MLRLGGRSLLAPALRRTALCQSKSTALYHSAGGGHTRTGQGLAAEVLPGIATARTPERTAELEALAEKHNGFLFGELVRPTALPSLKLLLLPCPPPAGTCLHAACSVSPNSPPLPPTTTSYPTLTPPPPLTPTPPCGAQPLEEGQSRQWEDWEYSWTPLMCSAAALYFVAYYFRPYHSMDEWARARAIERMNALEASASDEE